MAPKKTIQNRPFLAYFSHIFVNIFFYIHNHEKIFFFSVSNLVFCTELKKKFTMFIIAKNKDSGKKNLALRSAENDIFFLTLDEIAGVYK